jgi:hypothetical protein
MEGVIVPQSAALTIIRTGYVTGFWEGEIFIGEEKYERIYFILTPDGKCRFYHDDGGNREGKREIRFGNSAEGIEHKRLFDNPHRIHGGHVWRLSSERAGCHVDFARTLFRSHTGSPDVCA